VGVPLGCVIVAEDRCDGVECGFRAHCDRGVCECVEGFDGDPDEGCDPVQTVLLSDDCDDGLELEFALHAQERTWRWPEGSDVFTAAGLHVVTEQSIVCVEGELVCLGAQAGPLTWGVGLDGSEPCDWCCFECFSDVVDLGRLDCP
jgi:hypothetical protein